jgi:ABC-type antimicrobial peptide transport system permease subunit
MHNVTNLFVIASLARQREMAIRSALGAGRGQIVQQLLTESLPLGLIGGVLGVTLPFSA